MSSLQQHAKKTKQYNVVYRCRDVLSSSQTDGCNASSLGFHFGHFFLCCVKWSIE